MRAVFPDFRGVQGSFDRGVVSMADRRHKEAHARAAGAAGGAADGTTGAVRPRAAGASAGGVVPNSAGRGGDKARGAGVRLIGHNQSQFTSAAGGRRRRAAGGEPDGALWAKLTPRDRLVLELVAEHHVLTTEQLRALVFPSMSRAQHRLLHLADLGVLWRTQPYRADGGSKPFHYLLGYRGAELRAAQDGTSPPRPSTHADRLRRILESPRLGHLLGVNQFFAELADYSRRAGLGGFAADERDFGREGLHTWRSEESITEFYGNKITPDGYGCWHENGRWLGFFLEHDTGTEPLRRVADKIDRYTGSGKPYTDRFDVARRLAGMVLIWTTSARREQGLRKALQAKYSPVPVATASREHGHLDGPAGEVWSVVTAVPEQARRVRLGELPTVIGGTTDDGTPRVLAELATRPPSPLDDDDDDEGAYLDGVTDEMREANRRGLDVGDIVLTDPDLDEDTTSHRTPTRQPWQRWRRPA